jgi:diguanylate cyclase (GGDEF)-like protein
METSKLLATQPTFLLASQEPALLEAVEPVLTASGAHVEIVLSPETALTAITAPHPPSLVLLDVNLAAAQPGMSVEQLLAAVRASAGGHRFPIVLISDTVTPEWRDRLAEGVIDDLIPRAIDSPCWRLRLDMVLRTHHRMRELDQLREAAALNAQMDPLTAVYNRATLLAMLFRETDRVQRMKTSLCLILFDIDDFGHWNSRLGAEACDDLLCQVVERTARLLRSYDLFGRTGKDEFLLVLPGCAAMNAMMLAERLRVDVFALPFHLEGAAIRLSACFGIASSEGRSPVVVLREAEQALQAAKDTGPDSIQCFGDDPQTQAAPVAFLSAGSGDELLAW